MQLAVLRGIGTISAGGRASHLQAAQLEWEIVNHKLASIVVHVRQGWFTQTAALSRDALWQGKVE